MKTLENYKFETNTNPQENFLGFIQGQIILSWKLFARRLWMPLMRKSSEDF